MEPHPGVFVSKASTDDWEPDPDVPGARCTSSCTPTACRLG